MVTPIPKNPVMKTLSSSLQIILVALFLSSCCNKDCPDCETLDKADCDCVPDIDCLCSDGIQNGNETGVDCGGDCDPCFECMTSYCALLAGATSEQDPGTKKKWIAINVNPIEYAATFFSNGFVYVVYDDPVDPERTGIGTGSWAFDDPVDPKYIYQTYMSSPPAWSNPYPWTIMQLTADTLKVQNEVGGIMILVPES